MDNRYIVHIHSRIRPIYLSKTSAMGCIANSILACSYSYQSCTGSEPECASKPSYSLVDTYVHVYDR